jgi:phosphomannomutase / phosphoglucomutase
VRWFGTNGIREVVGQKLTSSLVTQISNAIAQVCPVGDPIAVGWDGRTSSPGFAHIVSGTLAVAGHRVIDLGLLPTPAIQYNVPRVGAQLGVIVTASHNPPEFNGIKCIARDGLEVPREMEESIEAAIERNALPTTPFDEMGSMGTDSLGSERYVAGILQQVDRKAIRDRKFSVVLDCGNGASVPTSPQLFRRLGCRVVSLNAHVDGTFPGHLSEPTETNLADLCRVVPAIGADLGVAHDGDADRAVFVDATGRYIPGEKILTLFAKDRVERHRGGVVVTPVSASQAVEEVVRAAGGEVEYTRVGSPTVTHAMQRRQAIFGGEENGGLIFPEFQLARDGAMSAAAMFDLLARRGIGLAEALRGLPEYTLLKEKIACPVDQRTRAMEHLSQAVLKEGGRVVTLDGVKILLPDGWILLRPSGTEAFIRVFAEAKAPARARELADLGIARVRGTLQELGVAST